MIKINRPSGMLERAFNAYIDACAEAKINPNRIMQTIGNAKASAGYHAKDGSFVTSSGVKKDYCASTDIRSKDLTKAEVINLIRCLAKRGFVPYWRYTGSFANNQHIHFIYAGCYMKSQLRAQVLSFLTDRNGLVGNAPDPYWSKNPASKTTKDLIRTMFYSSNPRFTIADDELELGEEDCCLCGVDFENGSTVADDTD